MKNYKIIEIPFLEDAVIREIADNFRNKYWNDSIPVDIENIIDVSLRINIIPVSNLSSEFDTVAFIAADWENLYVDKKIYEDERYTNRLRFSLAHEIGHKMLHKDLYEVFQIETVQDYCNFIQQIPEKQYGYLETQAHKFAAALLAPVAELRNARDSELVKFQKELKRINPALVTLNSYIAIPLSKKFGISRESMEIALNNLDRNR